MKLIAKIDARKSMCLRVKRWIDPGGNGNLPKEEHKQEEIGK